MSGGLSALRLGAVREGCLTSYPNRAALLRPYAAIMRSAHQQPGPPSASAAVSGESVVIFDPTCCPSCRSESPPTSEDLPGL
jgi:hypothetical protein